MQQEIEVLADERGLARLMRFCDMAERALPMSLEQRYVLRLVVEEIATNIMKYGYPPAAPGQIRVACDCTAGVLRVMIADQGAPFDPGEAPMPDLGSSLDQRRAGGLGLFLVRELTDTLSYWHDAQSGWNELVAIKHGRAPDA